MKRVRFISLVVVIAIMLGLVGGYAKTYITRNSASLKLQPNRPQVSPAQQQPPSIGTLHAQGLPIQFTNAFATDDGRAVSFSFVITNNDSRAINSLDLVLFDFNPEGKLMRVQSWNLQSALKSGTAEKQSFRLSPRAASGGRLILSAESVGGESGAWKVDFSELVNAASTLVTTNTAPVPNSTRSDKALPEYFGGVYCGEAFSKAIRLSQTGDEKRLNAFQCDRERRLFSFGFNAKSLKKS